ncbi:MAG TPA: EamA family transporter [Candidatus Binatia bacterium]|jgi:drug/metabolite transporter, DME family|nr:EamA family transporter [Candidatus Binatia bacterium]HME61694.1 EamA family transporter [Candidatus Binatia bacterium]
MSPQFFAWLTAFSFAVANVTVRHGMRYSTPLTATFVSLIIHTVVLWTAVFLTGGIPRVAWLGVAAIFLTGVVQPAMRVFQYKGMEKIGTSRAITLRNSYPVLSVVIGIVFLGEQITLLGTIGTVLIVAGIVLSSWKLEEQFKDFRWLYVIYPLITASITSVVHPLRRFALLQSNEPLFFAALVGPISLLSFAAYYATPVNQEKLVWDRRAFWPFLLSGLGETLAVLFMLNAFANGPVVIVSPISATSPIWTALLGAIFLRQLEGLTWASMLGTISVVAGVIAITLVR